LHFAPFKGRRERQGRSSRPDFTQEGATKRVIVLVEDEPSLRKQVAHHLKSLGLDVIAVADGDAALAVLREQRADLLCLDVGLPRMSGYEVCEQIRSDPAFHDLAILMTSDGFSPEIRAHSFEAGADAYLSKPYPLDRLAREVWCLLQKPPVGGDWRNSPPEIQSE
jgi:DNA-binding response OmpR family regulator